MDTIDRLPQTGAKGLALKQQLKDKLIEHKRYIAKHGQDLPEIRHRAWRGAINVGTPGRSAETKHPATSVGRLAASQ